MALRAPLFSPPNLFHPKSLKPHTTNLSSSFTSSIPVALNTCSSSSSRRRKSQFSCCTAKKISDVEQKQARTGITLVNPATLKEVMLGWRVDGLRGRRLLLAKITPAVVCWSLWKERNSRGSGDKELPVHRIVIEAIHLLHAWTVNEKEMEGVRVDDLIVNWEGAVFDPG